MASELPLSKEAILDAAEQVLRRYGPEKTSVLDVARVLGVSHGTIYRHFPSKAALREAATERWLHHISEPLERIVESADAQGSARLKMWFDALVRSKRGYAAQDPEMFAMYTAVTMDSVPIITAHIEQLLQQIARILAAGIERNEFRVGDPGVQAKALFQATARFHHPAHAFEWSSASIDEEFEAVWSVLLRGIELK